MAAAQQAADQAAGSTEPRHGLRIFLLWLPLALIADLLLWFVYGPHMPPGDMSTSAASEQFDIKVMAVMGAPVMLAVLVYAGYALTTWRTKISEEEDGPPIEGNTRVQLSWITISTVLVLCLAAFGTYELYATAGAGAGEGPSPIWRPDGKPLEVQVIAQQWLFTYRYPQFGGFETTDLVLPVGEPIQFNVTSLDVIHDFWAYQLGVKADANPQVNNVAYTTATHTGGITVRCDELCGLWHGAMFDYGKVVSVAKFQAWARATETKMAKVTRTLPKYALVYYPNEIKGLAKFYYEAGLPGAGGGYYANQYYPNEP
jgi:cytochrome c oxidase subunit II